MPELTVSRTNTAPPPMVCMYCGAPATVAQEWREVNRKPNPGGGGTDIVAPAGDDPVSAAIGLMMLPFALWALLKALVLGIGAVVGFFNRPRNSSVPPPPPPPKEPPTMLVVVTACDRHRRFRARFAWAGAAVAVVLFALWWWAIAVTRRVMGTDDTDLAVTLIVAAILSTILLPLAVAFWYTFAGPVIVDRVTEETVVLDRVRQAYFDATGRTDN